MSCCLKLIDFVAASMIRGCRCFLLVVACSVVCADEKRTSQRQAVLPPCRFDGGFGLLALSLPPRRAAATSPTR